MSLITIINRIEEERSLNQTLLAKLIAGLDDDILKLEQKKRDLEQEFAERDAALTQIIDGDQIAATPEQSVAALEADEPVAG